MMAQKGYCMNINDVIKARRKELNLTLAQVAKACGVSEATASRWESGDIGDMKRNRITSLSKVLKLSPSVIVGTEDSDRLSETLNNIPLYSHISCGTGLFIDDNVEDYIAVPDRYMSSQKEYFANVAQGDSMIGKGIKDGDVLVFEKTNILDNGEIGSFCIDENEAVCKVFRKLSNGMILLESANEKYDPIPVDLSSNCFRVIGRYKFKFSVEQ